MRQVKASWIFFLLLAVSGNRMFAQYNTTAFYSRTYDANGGLPDSYVLCITQDQDKYIWAGTYSGLSRFDGKTFTNFGISNGLHDLFISAVFVDSRNKVWVGTRSEIGYIESDRFIQTPPEDKTPFRFVFNFAEVEKGTVWAFTDRGLYEWNGKVWRRRNTVPGKEQVACRYALRSGDATYYCYPNEIIRESGGRFTTIAGGQGAGIDFVHFKKSGNRLFTTTQNGLFEITAAGMLPLFQKELAGKTIYTYFIDKKQRIWLVTEEDGLLVSMSGEYSSFTYRIPLSASLTSWFYEDADGNIWVANFKGLVRIRPAFFSVLTPAMPDMKSQTFIFAASENNVYVFANHRGLYQFNNGQFSPKKFADANNVFNNKAEAEVADAISIDKEKNFWVVTRGQRLMKISPAGKEELILPSGVDDTSSIVHYISMGKEGQVYICGRKLFISHGGRIEEFRARQTGLPITQPLQSAVMANGNVLVNSIESGLWMIKPDNTAYCLSATSGIEISQRLVFVDDKDGRLWISYPGTGLSGYQWKNDSTLVKESSITTKEALPNNVIESMAVDGKNRVWVATLSGLVVIDTLAGSGEKSYTIYKVGKEQGLDLLISPRLTKLMSNDKGNIWFATNDAVIYFRADELMTHSPPPLTHIESVKLNMQETDWHRWADSLTGSFMLPYKLRLPYNQRILTFNYKGINFDYDDDIYYSHRLVGVDTGWTYPSVSNSFSFIRLSPGTFTFEVRSRRTNSAWSQPERFEFTILPPFWQTWWFRSLGILAASLILVFIFRTQLRRVSKKAALQNQLRSLEMKALKAQMNPHFVYNALNSIQSLVIDDKKSDALDYMVKFSRLLRQVLNHSELNVVPLTNELDSLRLYIQLEALRLNYTLSYSIKLDEHIIPENEMIPPLILQPFVENALWHGLGTKEGDKNLVISVTGQEDMLCVEITDNGIGRAAAGERIKPGNYHEGPRGMNITENRLKAYNDKAIDKPITIDDLYDSQGRPAGTKVTLRIRRN